MRALRPTILAGLALALLAGCNMSGRPTDSAETAPAPAVAPVAPAVAPAVPATYVVVPGDTVYGLARRFGVDRRELIRTNNLVPPYKLLVGQRLILPTPAGAVVQGASAEPPAPAPAAIPSAAAPAAAGEPAPPPAGHTAVTATPLAPPPGATAKPPASAATQAAAAQTAAAQAAAAQAGATPAVPPPPPPPPPPQPLGKATATAEPLVAPPTPPPPPAEAAPSAAKPAESKPAEAKPAETKPAETKPATGEAKPAAAGKFLWPVDGKVIAKFGSIANGLHNDGINIAVPEGTPVHAADGGVVAYAGNELKGFGNLLLIRHPNGWMSAYAHNETLLVKRGDSVKRGQVIAKAGATGNVTSPQLHFELRHNTEAVDPQAYLGSS
jgi:murein DD-endopeptidase MepM/ murein hydrolase activator NlpD